MAADRQQAESQLHHLRGTRAVDDSVEVALARGPAEFLGNICGRLALDADDVIGPVFLGEGEIVGIAVESDNRCPAPRSLAYWTAYPPNPPTPKTPNTRLGPSAPASRSFLMPRYGVTPASVSGASCSNCSLSDTLIR